MCVMIRNTGDTVELARMQVFAIEAQDAQIDIHPEANPTAVRTYNIYPTSMYIYFI